MKLSRIYLSQAHMSGNELKYIHDVLQPAVDDYKDHSLDAFEEVLENYLQNNSFVSVLNSGTAAIHLGLILLGVKTGDEVLCQSMTFSASVNPILYLGATPIFIDSEIDTWNICPMALEKAIIDRIEKGKKPKVIIAVHLYGVPYKIDEISAIARQYEIPILEDSAEAFGSTYKGQKCGTFGAIGVLSFNGNKIITTSGGGAIVTRTKEFKDKALYLATQARDNVVHYQHSEIGYNYRLSNICAGIGRGQMEVLDSRVAARRSMHDFYVELFNDIAGVTVFSTKDDDSFANYWLSALLIDPIITNGIDREVLRLAFEADNIESRPIWMPMHIQPIFRKFPYYGTTIAQNLFDNGLCLPSSSNLNNNDKARITAVVQKLFSVES